MTKRQIIDEIILLNRSAKPEFLAQFDSDELDAYLRHLQLAQTPRLSHVPGRFSKYFQNTPAAPTEGRDGVGTFAEPTDHLRQVEPFIQPESEAAAKPAGSPPMLFGSDLDQPAPAVTAAWANRSGDDVDAV